MNKKSWKAFIYWLYTKNAQLILSEILSNANRGIQPIVFGLLFLFWLNLFWSFGHKWCKWSFLAAFLSAIWNRKPNRCLQRSRCRVRFSKKLNWLWHLFSAALKQALDAEICPKLSSPKISRRQRIEILRNRALIDVWWTL